MTTPRHGWNKWIANQANANQPFNNFLVEGDIQIGMAVVSDSVSAQPGSPSEGDAYILPASPTGAAWSTFAEHDVAYYQAGAWAAFTPVQGLLSFVESHDGVVMFNGSFWQAPPQNVTSETGTSYTLVATDKIVEIVNAAAITLTVPTNASLALKIGTEFTIIQTGAGAITLSGTGIVGKTATTAQYDHIRLIKTGADNWIGL